MGHKDLKFIVPIRDGRDVWASFQNYDWGPSSVEQAAKWWSQTLSATDGVEGFHHIRYEDLLEDPKKCLGEIYEYIDLEYEEVDFTPSTASVGRYKKDLSEKDLEIFNDIAGEQLRRYGYET